MDCCGVSYADGTMNFKSDESSACSSSDHSPTTIDSDISSAASSSSLSNADVVKCCLCMVPTQLASIHTIPSCLHVFCSRCLD